MCAVCIRVNDWFLQHQHSQKQSFASVTRSNEHTIEGLANTLEYILFTKFCSHRLSSSVILTHTRQVHHSEIHVSVNFHNHSVHLFSIAAIPFPANRRKVAHKVKPISANENWLQMIRGHQSHHSNIHKIHNTHIHRRQMCVCLCISKWKILFSTISQICIHLSTFTFN